MPLWSDVRHSFTTCCYFFHLLLHCNYSNCWSLTQQPRFPSISQYDWVADYELRKRETVNTV
ncbi:hypothetical protein BaRGS_00008318, partial [Batillaria attramentaria]